MKRRSDRGLFPLVGAICALAFVGCRSIPSVEMSDIMDPYAYEPIEQDFTEAKLEKSVKEIDAQFSEPRTPARVLLSLETAELSTSKVNDYEAIWRASRAAVWLARNHPQLSEREKFARKGVAIGRKAIKLLPTRVEPYYFTALGLGAYAEIKWEQGYRPSHRLLKDAKDKATMAAALDPTYDYGGPHRFLGKLICDASGTPLSVGGFDEGLEHLQRATQIAPDFAQNHLFLAQAYGEDDESELAREELDAVFRTTSPPDYTVEHQAWLNRATQLLGRFPSGDSMVDVSGYEGSAASDEESDPVPSASGAETDDEIDGIDPGK